MPDELPKSDATMSFMKPHTGAPIRRLFVETGHGRAVHLLSEASTVELRVRIEDGQVYREYRVGQSPWEAFTEMDVERIDGRPDSLANVVFDKLPAYFAELKPDTGGLAYLKPETGEPTRNERPSPDAVVREALRLLRIEDHIIDDDEAYEAFLDNRFSGCTVCEAGFLLRGLLEGRELPPLPLPQYSEEEETEPTT